VLVAPVEHERARAEVLGQRVQFAADRRELFRREDADPLQPFRVRAAGLDVEQEEIAVEEDVVTGTELLDALVDADAGLLPEEVGHVVSWKWQVRGPGRSCGNVGQGAMAVSSGKPKARLRFCSACVAAPLSRLSSVATTTSRLPSSERVKPPISTWCRPAIALTHGASSTIRTSGSPA